MIINVTFDSSVGSAPAGFIATVDAVVQYYENQFTDPITVNIDVGYGEVDGQALSPGALGESITFLNSFSFSQLRSALAADATSAADQTAVASLPSSNPACTANFGLRPPKPRRWDLPARAAVSTALSGSAALPTSSTTTTPTASPRASTTSSASSPTRFPR